MKRLKYSQFGSLCILEIKLTWNNIVLCEQHVIDHWPSEFEYHAYHLSPINTCDHLFTWASIWKDNFCWHPWVHLWFWDNKYSKIWAKVLFVKKIHRHLKPQMDLCFKKMNWWRILSYVYIYGKHYNRMSIGFFVIP